MGGYNACYWNSLNPQTESNPNRDLKNSLSLKISILILNVSKKTQKQRLKIVNIWSPPQEKARNHHSQMSIKKKLGKLKINNISWPIRKWDLHGKLLPWNLQKTVNSKS